MINCSYLVDFGPALASKPWAHHIRGLRAKAMLRDAWNMRLALAVNEKEALQQQIKDVNRQLENMLGHIVEANSASVVNAYESRLEKLEREKPVLNERIAKSVPPKGRLEDCIELLLKFPLSPCNI